MPGSGTVSTPLGPDGRVVGGQLPSVGGPLPSVVADGAPGGGEGEVQGRDDAIASHLPMAPPSPHLWSIVSSPPPPCIDSIVTGFEINGSLANCNQLLTHCDDARYGPAIRRACPQTCKHCGADVCEDSDPESTGFTISGAAVPCSALAEIMCAPARLPLPLPRPPAPPPALPHHRPPLA